MSRPKFSIVIATRNRAGLLRHALASALAQSYDDYEVVVSDNASTPETRAVVEAASDPRLRYVRSDRALTNVESFEFAVSHAEGEWITVLGDDDGFVPGLLSRVEPLTSTAHRVIGWSTGYYVHPDTDPPWPVEPERNVVTVYPFSGDVVTIDGRDQLERLFQRREINPIPSVRDCFVHRSLIEELARTGSVFNEPDAGWASAVSLLTLIPSYVVLDLPLSLTGCHTTQIGGGILLNTTHGKLGREFDRDDLLESVPLQTRTCVNVVGETLLRGRAKFAPLLDEYDLDPVAYFLGSHEELTDPRRADDGGAGLSEWRDVLSRQPSGVRRAVRLALARRAAAGRLRALARKTPLRRTRLLSIQGADAGFSELAQAAAYLEDAVLPAVSQASTRVAGIGTTN